MILIFRASLFFPLFLRTRRTFSLQIRNKNSRMSENGIIQTPKIVFTQCFNPLTGKTEWETQDENYDYHQEIARSAYADMLHDVERNNKYFAALKWAIDDLRTRGKPVRVLDIGTGTGLLSLMAAELGADVITACEAFSPMAECARHVIKQNGFGNKIRLIPKRSTEITVGPDCDMQHRANILVTEVFDTELIGEGAISTFNHAHKHLLEKDCLVIPSRANVYAQIVESDLLWSWNRPRPLSMMKGGSIMPPDEIQLCHGSPAVLDIQMSQLPSDSFRPLSDPILIAKFDFTGVDVISEVEHHRVQVTAKDTGKCEAIFFWWDIEMDSKGGIKLSCAPWWHHSLDKKQPWRDHWMQAVYYPPQPASVQQGKPIILDCFHDEYSFWFNILSENKSISTDLPPDGQIRRPTCTCGFHNLCNPNRIGMISDSISNNKYLATLGKLIKPNTICACIGNGGSMLPLMAAKLGANKVYAIDSEQFSVKILQAFIRRNKLEDVIKVLEKPIENLNSGDFEENKGRVLRHTKAIFPDYSPFNRIPMAFMTNFPDFSRFPKVDVFLSEPYFLSSLLPWHDLHYWYALNSLSQHRISFGCSVPKIGKLWAMGMHFLHLWKIKAPLNQVEGFKMGHFDHVIQNSSHIADHPVESHPLWEYEGLALTNPFLIYTFDLNQTLPEAALITSGIISLLSPEHCNCVALWMEWILDEETGISRGPILPTIPGQSVKWNPTSKQGVYFLPYATSAIECKQLSYQAKFDPKLGTFEFNFSTRPD